MFFVLDVGFILRYVRGSRIEYRVVWLFVWGWEFYKGVG